MIRDYDDAVNMIGHYDKLIKFNILIMAWQVIPTMFDNPSHCSNLNLPAGDVPEQTHPSLGADGDKIGSRLRIVISS